MLDLEFTLEVMIESVTWVKKKNNFFYYIFVEPALVKTYSISKNNPTQEPAAHFLLYKNKDLTAFFVLYFV